VCKQCEELHEYMLLTWSYNDFKYVILLYAGRSLVKVMWTR